MNDVKDFMGEKQDNIIFERLIPSNAGISSVEFDQNALFTIYGCIV